MRVDRLSGRRAQAPPGRRRPWRGWFGGRIARGLRLGPLALTLVGCGGQEPHIDAPGLRVGDVLGASQPDARFARAEYPRAFVFPADHGAHPDFRSEWWYLTLALEDGEGREFGVQFTVFRQAMFPAARRTTFGATAKPTSDTSRSPMCKPPATAKPNASPGAIPNSPAPASSRRRQMGHLPWGHPLRNKGHLP